MAAMPMQVSLDEVISMLLARMEGLSMAQENMKSKFNIIARALYNKGLLTDTDIYNSLVEEHQLLKELGAIQEMPDQATLKVLADSMLQWIKNDAEAIKASVREYEEKMREAMREEERKPKIDVASPAVLQQLDNLSKNNKGGKLIIP